MNTKEIVGRAVASAAALALVWGAGSAAAQTNVDKVLTEQKQVNNESAASQKKIDKISDDTGQLLAEYRAVNQQLDNLRIYNRQLQTLVDGQREEMTSLQTQIENVTVSARHRLRRLANAPPAGIPALVETASLLYDEVDRTDAGVTVLLPREALLYLNYARDRRQNDPRDVGFRFNGWNAGVSLPVNPRLSMSLDWSRQDWAGRGGPLQFDPLRLNFGRPLVSDGNSINLGAAYLAGRDRFTTNLYRFTASGGEDVRGHGIALGWEPAWSAWFAPRLQIGWDDYEDSVLPGFGFSDGFVRVDLARRF